MNKIAIAILLLPLSLAAQRNVYHEMDAYMQAHAKVNQFSGVVLVSQHHQIIYEKAFGLADREWNIANTTDTKFQIGSITKQFTASAILQLGEEGKLSVSDKLSQYFPNFPKGDSITIHMLLSHTSGIKNYTSIPEFWKMASQAMHKDTMVALMASKPFDFSPGTGWNYSNSNYFLLGYIIEKVSGESYSSYLMHHIFQKAGLKNTLVNRWDSILPRRAKGYDGAGNNWVNASYISMEGPYSAGALVSTVEDLWQWENALFSYQVIGKNSLEKMTTPYRENYGYGLSIDSLQNHVRIGHSGGINGFASYEARFPAEDLVVVGLSNNERTATSSIVSSLAAIVLGIPVDPPHTHIAVKTEAVQLKRYVGKYQIKYVNNADSIILQGANLYWKIRGDRELLMKAESPTHFYLEDVPDIEMDFVTDKNGKIIRAYFINAGVKTEMKKLD